MTFMIRDLTPTDAMAIAAWHYPEPYAFYDMAADPEDLEAWLDFDSWPPDSKFAVCDERGGLFGFFEFTVNDGIVDVGLGMRPDQTGFGQGLAFVQAGLAFARDRFSVQRFQLAVAAFNQRAIRVYEKVGFKPGRRFMNQTNGGIYEFLEMTLEL